MKYLPKVKIVNLVLIINCLAFMYSGILFGGESNSKALLLGFGGGFGAAYGNGIQAGYVLRDNIDINVGAGFNLSGGKLGIGSRLYIYPSNKITPFLGANIVRSTGLSEVRVTVNENEAFYKIPSNVVLNGKAGVRYRKESGTDILGAIGYGVAIGDNDAEYISGSKSDAVKDFADLATAGGIDISLSVLYYFR